MTTLIPVPAMVTLPSKVVHSFSVLTSFELLIAKVPDEGAQSGKEARR